MSSTSQASFESLNLSSAVLAALQEIGYETPSPIQAAAIPHILEGRDILGQAQTGTGKTAAFALPILSRVDFESNKTQVLILAPTRELAIQVAEAFQSYARHIPNFHVLPIYGGQGYDSQLRQLRRGAQVVVGTPGRVMDHIERKTLKLQNLQTLVLDEADEMLRMGFIEDVEWILSHTPDERQIALFSATMPTAIRKIAEEYLSEPEIIKIKSETTTNQTITQTYLPVRGPQKLEALTRLLEVIEFDAMIVFVRTKNATEELAEKLAARGHAAAALNGDIVQKQRERTVEKLKKGHLDIVIATDVAARGLDVERISHVINYDIPYDSEAYVHRIGRTGRAGRSGEAILFVTSREQRMLKTIERATRQDIEKIKLPSIDIINEQRINRFKQRIGSAISNLQEESPFKDLIADMQLEHDLNPLDIAAALAQLLQGDEPLLLDELPRFEERGSRGDRGDRGDKRQRSSKAAEGMTRYRIEVGRKHKVKPGNIVGAIANEANIQSRHIGPIEIYEHFTTVDLPSGMPKDTLEILQKARICGQKTGIRVDRKPDGKSGGGSGKPPKGKSHKGKRRKDS